MNESRGHPPHLLWTLRGLLRDGAALSERGKGPTSPVVTELLGLGVIEVWGCGKATTSSKVSARGRRLVDVQDPERDGLEPRGR